MEFLKPVMLWGALAIAIPILIHFWHQKRGKVHYWAAMQWLIDKSQQQHWGIKLDNLPLLILRCLILLVLVFLLSRPVINYWEKSIVRQKVHLVQPDPYVTDNYRFELEEAILKGEKIYWILPGLVEAESLTDLREQKSVHPLEIQTAVNQLKQRGVLGPNIELNLYVLNEQDLAQVSFIWVPHQLHLHAVADTSRRGIRQYVELPNNKKLFVNVANQLTTSGQLPVNLHFQPTPLKRSSLTFLLEYSDPFQKQTVEAALRALSEVYSIPMIIHNEVSPDITYDWILTDQFPKDASNQTYYVVSNGGKQVDIEKVALHTLSNVHYVPEVLTAQASEMVANGQLPEWLGELLVREYGLKKSSQPLSQQELKALFVQSGEILPSSAGSNEPLNNGLLVLLILLVGAERWIALRKQA